MISVELATTLKGAGLVWKPTSGDRFTLITGAFDGEVFTLSDMVVEAQESRTGTVLGFNGTTEWALDATEATDALWLPREDQLRVLLGSSFRTLERVDGGYRVTAVLPGELTDAPDQGLADIPHDEPTVAHGDGLADAALGDGHADAALGDGRADAALDERIADTARDQRPANALDRESTASASGGEPTTEDGSSAGAASPYWGADPSEAYGRALLALIRRATD